MKKPLNTAFVYEVWKQHAREEITFSRMVELLNEEVIKNTQIKYNKTMTPNHDFTNAKLCDPIHTLQWGEGIIIEICPIDEYPIKAEFKHGKESFLMNGVYHESEQHPTAFTEPIKVVPASYEPFVEQEMMVWDNHEDIQNARIKLVFAKHKGWYAGRENRELYENSNSYFWQNALPIHEWEAKVKESKNQKEITEIEFQIAELQAKLEKLKG